MQNKNSLIHNKADERSIKIQNKEKIQKIKEYSLTRSIY